MGQRFDEEMARRQLRQKAYSLRQEAIRNGDYDTWRIARAIRDVATTNQAREADRRLDRWWGRLSR